MARDQVTITVQQDEWTQLTNGNVTAITFQVLEGAAYIRFTTDETTPTETAGLLYRYGEGELNKTVSDITNLASADRVWAKGAGPGAAKVYVDHA